MLGEFEAENRVDENGNPTGGFVNGVGLSIVWQDGPLGRGEDRVEPNGAFVETVLAAVKQRIEFYQTASEGRFACHENADVIASLEYCLRRMDDRTKAREARAVEGTHTA